MGIREVLLIGGIFFVKELSGGLGFSGKVDVETDAQGVDDGEPETEGDEIADTDVVVAGGDEEGFGGDGE